MNKNINDGLTERITVLISAAELKYEQHPK